MRNTLICCLFLLLERCLFRARRFRPLLFWRGRSPKSCKRQRPACRCSGSRDPLSGRPCLKRSKNTSVISRSASVAGSGGFTSPAPASQRSRRGASTRPTATRPRTTSPGRWGEYSRVRAGLHQRRGGAVRVEPDRRDAGRGGDRDPALSRSLAPLPALERGGLGGVLGGVRRRQRRPAPGAGVPQARGPAPEDRPGRPRPARVQHPARPHARSRWGSSN